ncbi:caspase family protein [Vibrio harveyi]
MNLGIVLAVSDYGNPKNNLPGCKADGDALSEIFRSDDKFDDVLILTENTESGEVKNQLIEFINKYKDKEVSEVVFYYTGHGDFSSNEFYFLLSNYDSAKKKQTSLENTELDNLLRTLSPKVTVKIVDACHSGKAYIKDSDAFDKYLNETKSSFDKCYFMYSSQLEQYSYQDESLSFFTKSIVDAVKNHSASSIRYKDIIDYVSDSFESNSEQTPFFVVQADFTEPFCSISSSLRDALTNISVGKTPAEPKDEPKFSSIVEKIKADAERYCSEEEAYTQFNSFTDLLSVSSFNGDLASLYDCKVKCSDGYARNPLTIGNWLDNADHQYFAQATYKLVDKTRRVRKRNALSALTVASLWDDPADFDDDSKYKIVRYKEKEVSGYNITIEQPVKLVEIIADSLFPNILSGKAFVVPLLSKTELRVFYSFVHYAENGWNEKTIKQEAKWLTKVVPLKGSDYQLLANDIIKGFGDYLLEAISKAYDIKQVESSEDSAAEDSA